MTIEEFNLSYWNYYLMLEKKFINTLSYVSLSPDNYDTFSNEYANLIQSIGSELDSFFKIYCDLSSTDTHINISNYANHILSDWEDIKNQVVRAMNIEITPFESWDINAPKQSLCWWEAFEEIKHSRVTNEKKGSLKNTLYLLAALYLLEMKWLKTKADKTNQSDIPDIDSKLFILVNWNTRYKSLSGAMFEIQ